MPDPRKVRADANAIVTELLERLANDAVSELEVKRGGVRVRVTKNGGVVMSAPGVVASPHVVPAAPATKELPPVNAPLTGIFYRSSSPQTEAFVQVGSNVETGQVIGLIEAMKLFNEIRSTESGRVRRIFAENGQLVRSRQPLLEVEPS